MTATALDRNTFRRGPIRQVVLPLAVNETIPFGVMVMVLTPSTGAKNAADTATGIVIGMACMSVSYAAGDRKIVVEKTIARYANNGNVTAAHVGSVVTVVDNQTVGLAADTTNDVGAGIVDSVDADGVWVDQTGARVSAT